MRWTEESESVVEGVKESESQKLAECFLSSSYQFIQMSRKKGWLWENKSFFWFGSPKERLLTKMFRKVKVLFSFQKLVNKWCVSSFCHLIHMLGKGRAARVLEWSILLVGKLKHRASESCVELTIAKFKNSFFSDFPFLLPLDTCWEWGGGEGWLWRNN